MTPFLPSRNQIGARILIVEDEFIVARDLQRRLEMLGFRVLSSVATGEDAIAKAAETSPDLVLVDISLRGGMDGIEAARRIREKWDIPIVFATANSDRETFERAKEASPSGYVLKPFDERELGLIIDVALYKHATDRVVKESEARYRSLFESSSDGLLLVSGTVLDCNRKACELFEAGKEEILGCRLADFAPDRQPDGRDSAEKADDLMRHALDGEGQACEWRLLKRTGASVDVSLAANALLVGGRRVVEIALRASSAKHLIPQDAERLAAIVESSDDAIFSKSLDGTITSWNAGAEKIYGYKAEEIIGRSVTTLLPEGRKDEIFDILARLRGGDRVEHFETVRVRKDGSAIDVSISVSPIKNGSGEVVAASTIARDISDKKRAIEQTEAALREKELLLHEMHHRLKNNIQIVSSLLSLQAKATPGEEIQRLIRQGQDRLNSVALIHEKLFQSHDQTHIEFGDYVRGLVSDLARSYGTERIHLRVEADRGEFNTETAVTCGLILNELITNAFKYAFPGDRKGDVVVHFITEGKGDYLLSVSDNGIGMPGGVGRGGHGLGLQLVETLVDQLGGRMELDGSKGTVVRIAFKR